MYWKKSCPASSVVCHKGSWLVIVEYLLFFHLKRFFLFFAVAPKLVTPSSSLVLLKHQVLGSGPGCPRQRRQHPGPRNHQHHQPVQGTRGRLQTNWGPDSGGEGRRSQPGRSLRLWLKLPKNTFCHQSGRQFADAWCLLGYTNAGVQKKKSLKMGEWGRGIQSRNQEFLPCLSLVLCHPFVLYLRASTRKFTCGGWNLPEEGVALRHGGAGNGCGILSSVSCVHSLGERKEEKFPSTDWLTEVRFYVSQCNVKWCDTRMMPPPRPPRPDFFLSSILELGNDRCHRLQVDQSSIPQPS